MTALILLFLLFVFVFGLPVVLFLVSMRVNLKTDCERFTRYRRELGPGFWGRSILGAINAMASTGFIGLTFVLGRWPWRQGGGEGVPVVLVHGLYHNPSAWMAFRRVLRRSGFGNIYMFRYGSFTRTYADLVFELTVFLERVMEENPDRRLALVGHSLGGVVIRGTMADDRFAGKIGAVVTLGAPHQGSELAVMGIGRLARSLKPTNPLFSRLAAQEPVQGVDKLSLFTPLDNMVFPVRCLEVPESGWTQEARQPDVSHVGLIYDRGLANRAAEHLSASLAHGALGAAPE